MKMTVSILKILERIKIFQTLNSNLYIIKWKIHIAKVVNKSKNNLKNLYDI